MAPSAGATSPPDPLNLRTNGPPPRNQGTFYHVMFRVVDRTITDCTAVRKPWGEDRARKALARC